MPLLDAALSERLVNLADDDSSDQNDELNNDGYGTDDNEEDVDTRIAEEAKNINEDAANYEEWSIIFAQ
jgi:hypothetical protein